MSADALPSFQSMYQAEVRPVHAFLWRMGLAEKDLGDAIQDVFVAALQNLGRYEPSRPLRPWLLGIAFRVFCKWRARNGTTTEPGDAFETARDEADAPDAVLEQKQASALVHRALLQLPEERRLCLVMYELNHVSVEDIAVAVGVPEATVYSRIRRGREEFKQAVERLEQKNARTL